MDCHPLLQRIFPTLQLNLGLLCCKQILYHLSYREDLETDRVSYKFNSILTSTYPEVTSDPTGPGLIPTRLPSLQKPISSPGVTCTSDQHAYNQGSLHSSSAAAKSLQLCPTLCDPIDGSPPGSPVPGILQARTLEWVAISFSNTPPQVR